MKPPLLVRASRSGVATGRPATDTTRRLEKEDRVSVEDAEEGGTGEGSMRGQGQLGRLVGDPLRGDAPCPFAPLIRLRMRWFCVSFARN